VSLVPQAIVGILYNSSLQRAPNILINKDLQNGTIFAPVNEGKEMCGIREGHYAWAYCANCRTNRYRPVGRAAGVCGPIFF
jgi:hypothetical protein